MEKIDEIDVNKPNKSDWLTNEAKELKENKFDGDVLPSLKFEEGKIVEFEVDFTNEFKKWVDQERGTVKKIIPVTHKGEQMNLWLNTRNPLYSELVEEGTKGITKFKVIQSGTQDKTKYTLVKE